MSKGNRSAGAWMAIGIALGGGIGVALGNIAIGAGVGVAIGAALAAAKGKKDEEP